jgi:hypothetical protein
MNAVQPPRAATWLLLHLGCSPNNAALVGDLDERYRRGRSRSWYWRQVLVAVTSQHVNQFRRISGVYMRRKVAFAGAALLALSVFLLQAQAQFTIRAASDQAVPGWDRLEYLNHPVWVSPIISLTSADIQRAEATTDANGRRAVGVIFNDAGAKKISDFSTVQLNKLVAMVLDGKIIFAPKVRGEMSKEALITGPASSGLSTEVVQRIVDSVKKR